MPEPDKRAAATAASQSPSDHVTRISSTATPSRPRIHTTPTPQSEVLLPQQPLSASPTKTESAEQADKYKTLKGRPEEAGPPPTPTIAPAAVITHLVPKHKKSKTRLKSTPKSSPRTTPTRTTPYRSYSTTDEDPESSDEDMGPGSLLAAQQRLPIGVPDKNRHPKLKSHASAPAVPMARDPSGGSVTNGSSVGPTITTITPGGYNSTPGASTGESLTNASSSLPASSLPGIASVSSPSLPTTLPPSSTSNSGTSTPAVLSDPVVKPRKASAPAPASNSHITVETETVPAVPTVSVAPPPPVQPQTDSNSNTNYQGGSVNSTVALSGGPQLGSGSNSLRLKKSQDVKSRKKKGRSQLSQQGNTKAEIFAAKVASAVDEVHSSDSDEDFVYESNPMEKPTVNPRALGVALGPTARMARPSVSSLSSIVHDEEDNPAVSVPDLNYDSSCSTTSDHPEFVNMTNNPRFQSRHPSLSSVGKPMGSSERRGMSQDYSDIEKDGIPLFPHDNGLDSKGQANRTFSGPPRMPPRLNNAHSGSHLGNDARKRAPVSNYGSLRNAASLARLGGGSLRRLGSYTKEDPPLEPTKTRGTGGSRRGPLGGSSSAGFTNDEEYYDFDVDADLDDEEFDDASESTPLRRGDSSRRVRKNGQFSPHNFHKSSHHARWRGIRRAIWIMSSLVAVLLTGFVFGFVLATNRPLQNVSVVDITELLISEQELVFDIVVKAFNPGILSVVVPFLDIDVFAKPIVSKDDKDEKDKNILLLGNIDEFDVPLRFEGGFFTRHAQSAMGEVRLNDPGVPRNATLDSGVPLMLRVPDKDKGDKDKEPLTPEERWKKICSEPFELIVRGVLKYDLPLFHKGQSTTVSKSVKVTPHKN
ncbi:vacuolar segregation subunit 7-domain-containing protein [Yarrowia lipolytica]|uniref:Vacuolar segregation subunit 7-domain-containing protein n=1 Tax=Yarrowia lipolytica TaxID=4952 RepID=A0A371CFV2_YARLL|nr:Vacuolar segregation protein 7 [Yarrowia lipolytica]RDW29161.1 vacuolar segregation subunit 7-domain-containing protein [Yarrowia lipolytica]RDW35044.1 vacuolar segregation subunit 7-domain-containing protein [Yarrowia lipolytica]RDW47314.1 vacuolar segregation subunit 7-domain-containing protein [Yarrowia lipolytica]RDW53483.1 vacuolar segregation subunit 7-domain-containing protein [Yarrowia lipolytica]